MKKITINGTEYPCRITMGAFLIFHELTGREASDISDAALSDMIVFIYACVKSACRADKVEFDLSLEAFADAASPDSLDAFYQQASIAEQGKKSERRSEKIEDILGIALGCVGMSYDDFCRCTPSEFSAVASSWSKHEDATIKRTWEQTRSIVVSSLQPYCKKALRATEVMPFRWDNEQNTAPRGAKSTRERMKEIEARINSKSNG